MKKIVSASQSFDSICSSSIPHTSHVASHPPNGIETSRDSDLFKRNVQVSIRRISRNNARNWTCFIISVPRVLDESWARCNQWIVWIHREQDWRCCSNIDRYQQMDHRQQHFHIHKRQTGAIQKRAGIGVTSTSLKGLFPCNEHSFTNRLTKSRLCSIHDPIAMSTSAP
jgi:hypothetical protein